MSLREEATKYALSYISKIDPSGINTEITRQELAALTDEQFAQLMEAFFTNQESLAITAPNFGKVKIDVERNIEIGKELGHNFFQKIIFHSKDPDTPSVLSDAKWLVMEMPWRRTVQMLVEGISVTKHNNSTNARTGAVSGDSEASKLSGPEFGVLHGMGMVKGIEELRGPRGGDEGSWKAMEASMQRTGSASLDEIKEFSTGNQAVRSLSVYLTAMHLANSL